METILKNKLIAVIIVLLLMTMAGCVIWYGTKNASNTDNQQNNNQKTNNTPTPTPDDPTKPTNNTTTVKIYFSKTGDTDCSKVYAINRTIPKTTMIGTAALNQLFKGPTDTEKTNGYTSLFSSKTANILNSLQVTNGVAYVNLKDIRTLIPSASSSCGSAQFIAEVESTLEQFNTVKKVVNAIDSDVEKFYEWVQIGCQISNNLCENAPLKTNLVKVTSPRSSAKISSPVSITGEARGSWFFEASFPIKIVDEQGKVIGSGIATATSDWMTSNFVPFTANISFTAPATTYGAIILERDNPSGLAINDDSVRVFVRFK
ncbi:GerMN domain-containing protein [Candidatus Berkelbacteria bacterium]|nr:GerMN domain-containing protein [Candidatus Berkelbacteria bacterium]